MAAARTIAVMRIHLRLYMRHTLLSDKLSIMLFYTIRLNGGRV